MVTFLSSGSARLRVFAKRCFDVLVAATCLVVTAPLCGLIAGLIRLDSKGPVFVRSRRIGRQGTAYMMLSFRTSACGASPCPNPRSEAGWLGDSDTDAPTKFGTRLRRHKLDILPRLWNVLIGDMSIVGPKPEPAEYLSYVHQNVSQAFSFRPGLIEPAAFSSLPTFPRALQEGVDPKSSSSEQTEIERYLREKIRLSLQYIRRQSVPYDMMVLLRAISVEVQDIEPGLLAKFGRWIFFHRRIPIVFLHLALFAISFVLAFSLRFDLQIPRDMKNLLLETFPLLLLVRVPVFAWFRLYEGLWRYVGIWDIVAMFKAVALSSGIFVVLVTLLVGHGFPRSIVLLDWLLCLALVAGVRMVMRIYREVVFGRARLDTRRALVVGAGDAAEILVREIQRDGVLDYEVVGFVDDDPQLRGQRIHGLVVLGSIDDLPELCRTYAVDEVLIAIPSAGAGLRSKILSLCQPAGVTPKTVPALSELLNGRARIGQLEEIKPEHLLGREAVDLDSESIRRVLVDQVVLVSGAAGSIGSELCRQIGPYRPKKMVLLDRAESALYFMVLDLKRVFPQVEIEPYVGDILDESLVDELMTKHRPEVVYHAAAYKHVPLMEHQPLESITNNLFGTEVLARASMRHKVGRFLLISTDKAVKPVGIMGMTKYAAECLLLSLQGATTTFTAVRFGNVLGSNGSVLPLFTRQIANGGPVTITDPDATRYFMLLSEAAQLVLQASAMCQGGEVFFLDMGKPVRIVDMATDLIRLSGLNPNRDMPVEVVGLRPGERLNETLLMEKEELLSSDHKKVFKVKNRGFDPTAFNTEVITLRDLVKRRDTQAAVEHLKGMVARLGDPGESAAFKFGEVPASIS